MYLKNLKNNIVTLIIVLSLIHIIIFGSVFIYSFNEKFYLDSFKENDLYSDIPYNITEIDENFIQVLDYVKGVNNNINSTFFNSKEIHHFKDVRDLFFFIKLILIIYIILVILILAYLFYNREKELIISSIRFASVFGFSLVFILLILISINFTSFFIFLHKILFSNNLWIMYYETDLIIRLLPESTFFKLGLRIIITILSSLILLYLLTYSKTIYKKILTYYGRVIK